MLAFGARILERARTLVGARASFITTQKRGHKSLAMMAAARLFFLLALLGNAADVEGSDGGRCESLKLKPPLTYTQDKAPRDLSGVVSGKLYTKFLEGRPFLHLVCHCGISLVYACQQDKLPDGALLICHCPYLLKILFRLATCGCGESKSRVGGSCGCGG